MVDPDASTRTEVPRESSDDGESSGHETDSFEGPYSPHTGDSTDEEELDYVNPADRLEHEVFTEEYQVAIKEYARLRRRRAIIAVGTASDEEIAQLGHRAARGARFGAVARHTFHYLLRPTGESAPGQQKSVTTLGIGRDVRRSKKRSSRALEGEYESK